MRYIFFLFMLILSLCVPVTGEITQINSLDNDRNQMINKSDYDNLSLFLSIDQTDKHEYLPWYTCGHYSRSLARNLSLFPEYSQYNLTLGSIILSNHPTMRGYQNHIMNYFIYQGEIWLIEPQTDHIYPLWDEIRFKYYRLYWDGTQVPTYWDCNLAYTGVIGIM